MKNRLWLALAGIVVLAALVMAGTTGALWRDEAQIDAGVVAVGNLELLAGGEPGNYVFTALSADNLAPGDSVSAPVTISNGGSMDLVYELAGVGTTAFTTADEDLADALVLTVTDDMTCGDGEAGSASMLYQGALASANFTGTQLSPSSSMRLCFTVALALDAPLSASKGASTVTFTFRGDQV